MRRVLVFGASGRVGRQVVTQLVAAGVQVRAVTRNPDAAGLPAAVEVLYADLSSPESVNDTLAGVDSVFLVWTVRLDTAASVIGRIAKHARHIVFLSSPHKIPHPFFQQPNPVRVVHAELERLIGTSGMQWTFLRPGMFASNALLWWAPQLRESDVVRWPYASVTTAPVHDRDIAEVAFAALTEEEHRGAEYVLTGPDSLSQADQVRIIGEAVGRKLRRQEISPDEARRELLTILPSFVIEMLLSAWVAGARQPAFVSPKVAAITGRPARTLFDWAVDHAGEFRRG